MADAPFAARADGHPVLEAPAGRHARLHRRLRHRLPMWVVYDTTTREYPGLWVARMHVSLPEPKATRFVVVAPSLDELRRALPADLHRLARQPGDVPEIWEVWL